MPKPFHDGYGAAPEWAIVAGEQIHQIVEDLLEAHPGLPYDHLGCLQAFLEGQVCLPIAFVQIATPGDKE